MSKYKTKPERIVFEGKDSLFHVSVFDEGGGPYIGIKTDNWPDSPTDLNAIWLESEEEVDLLAAQLKELLKKDEQ